MKVFQSLDAYTAGPHPVATIGTFDGLHQGHKVILRRIIEEAKRLHGESVLISFHPHPRLVLFPENNPLRLLHSLEEKIQMLDEMGLDKLLLIPFTKEFSRTPSKAFIRDTLIGKIGIQKIVIGYDHRFGKNRTGGIEELQELAQELQFEVEEIPAQAIDDANISSTKIRKALAAGDVSTANTYLGYAYGFSGTVVHGAKQGRTLGYPTANLDPLEPHKLIPTDGVYLVRAMLGEEIHHGLMSIGSKPTMGGTQQFYEVFIFDFNRDIYDQVLRVEFLSFLRGQQKFKGLDELMTAMKRDEANGRELVASFSS
ncbi:MAG: bifunctional riboflavin kinase/FAD synthetase [Bacteroidota bacterium]